MCQEPIVTARMRDPRGLRGFRLVALDRCAAGTGDVALVPSLFDDGSPPIAELVTIGTTYRQHPARCRVPSFTGMAPARKLK